MRKCKALPGARTELLSDLLIPNSMGNSVRGHSAHIELILQKSGTPAAWALAYAVLTAITSKTQTSPSSLFPRCPAPAQAAHFLRWPIPALFPSFGSDPGLGDLGFVPQLRERPRLRIQPWRRYWWT